MKRQIVLLITRQCQRDFSSKVASHIQQDRPRLHLFALADREILTEDYHEKDRDKSLIFISLVACKMKRSVALVLLLASVVRGDVDGLCVTLHCGIQSGACFLDGDCAKVLFLHF